MINYKVMFHHSINKATSSDDWESGRCYLEPLMPFISGKTINDPFYSTGRVKIIWKELGIDIVHDRKDFFTLTEIKEDIIVTNIPFSIKNRVLTRLFELDKPFITICPINTLALIKTQRIVKDKYIQIIIPNFYKGFINTDTGIQTKCPPFYVIYLCYKMKLSRDIIYL